MQESLSSTCNRHAREQVRLKRVDMCLSGREAPASLAHATTHALHLPLRHTEPLIHCQNPLSRDNPVPQLKTGRQSYVKNHLPGSPNESGTVAVGQRRAARCVLPPVQSHSMRSNKTFSQIVAWMDKFMSENKCGV